MRLDQFMVKNRLAASRTQAHDFITRGYVYLLQGSQKIILKKPSFPVDDLQANSIMVEKNQFQKFVSRAGLKLESALQALNIDVSGKLVLDVGQSTGGFTDCLVQRGVCRVTGIDVGHNQLHESLRDHPKVDSVEGLNVKEIETNSQFLKYVPAEKFDLIVMDVSFISITKVMPYLGGFLKSGGEYLFLVKPQFECGQINLDKNGIVKNPAVYSEIESKIKNSALEYFNNVQSYIKSEIVGKDGNQEYFVYGKNSI